MVIAQSCRYPFPPRLADAEAIGKVIRQVDIVSPIEQDDFATDMLEGSVAAGSFRTWRQHGHDVILIDNPYENTAESTKASGLDAVRRSETGLAEGDDAANVVAILDQIERQKGRDCAAAC
jgi:hypothetical protein